MRTLFISDLHLEDGRPQTSALFDAFLRGPAREADAVYILGDLFELWIGDDVLSATARDAAAGTAALRERGIPCYFLHGNRDFLLGQDFAQRAGLQLLPETFVADLYGTPTLLLHGDTLCTDDVGYQAFRQRVRSAEFTEMFLQLSPERRLEMAHNARDASHRYTARAEVFNIMDVNECAVRDAFRKHGTQRMIHGHTHRPAFHQHDLGGEALGERTVLADWHTVGACLSVSPEGYEILKIET